MAGAGKKQSRVRYGRSLSFSGRVSPGAQRSVRLEFAPRGQRAWRPVAETSSAADGSYRFALRPRHSGSYRAVADSSSPSAARRVSVIARLGGRAAGHVRRGARVRVKGSAGTGSRRPQRAAPGPLGPRLEDGRSHPHGQGRPLSRFLAARPMPAAFACGRCSAEIAATPL